MNDEIDITYNTKTCLHSADFMFSSELFEDFTDLQNTADELGLVDNGLTLVPFAEIMDFLIDSGVDQSRLDAFEAWTDECCVPVDLLIAIER
jgi:hypothetical protein